jgi:aspartate/methionine/tyrosine aminotransferase
VRILNLVDMQRQTFPQSTSRKKILASQVEDLARQYETMEETGEPFGTLVIAQMGQKLAEKGKDIIFCAESIISLKVPEVVLEETERNLREMAFREAPFLGLPELRQAIALRFERLYRQRVNWENEVIVTSGSMQSEYYLMTALLNPEDEVIVPVPTFFFDIPVKLARGKPILARLNRAKNFVHDIPDFEKLVTRKTRMITLCNPHNPTGRVLTQEELSSIADFARRHDLLIMHDQVYEGIVYDGRKYVPMAEFKEVRDRLISISSFSKVFNMMNYRLGYAIAPPEIIHGMEMVHSFSSMGIPSLIQKGAVPALDPQFERKHLTSTISMLQKSRDYALEKLSSIKGVRIHKPEGTNLMLPDISAFGMSSMEFCKYLLKEAGVACAPGIAYHIEGCVRISLGNERIYEAIDRVARAISKLQAKKAGAA